MAALGFGLAYAGFLGLCLAMDRHHAELLRGRPAAGRRWLLRGVGWLLLGLSLLPCLALWGVGIGIVAWLGLLTVAAYSLVHLIPYAPRLALWLGPLLPLAGLALSLAPT
ncbi:DUF3325 domain-containing protein [Roseicella frigidaeris]|uniref:DUF3325 domain-containing protein n=1 Tax=Roseicella frigidaeris TaxID=2230885 RepID=A0A327M8D6_9PROT|nr:DUF3325 domain-containing protein [Roseicella frigidaeris]RAI59571.1 DUF3325 domain-containing protein [Roseicella frigidaeris]